MGNNINILSNIENIFFEKYKLFIEQYKDDFSCLNCGIQLTSCWTDSFSRKMETLPVSKGKYIYWIIYEIIHDGKPFVYDDENSVLFECYGVLKVNIKKDIKNITIDCCNDMSDLKEDIEKDLKIIRGLESFDILDDN